MQGVSVLLFLGLLAKWSSAVFLNHRPFPTYSLENMPNTQFSCREKVLGGYYADPDTQCQMFHICVKVAGIGVQDFKFLCPNGTAFDQDHQICADWEDVDCDATTLYYSSDNFDLYRIGSGFESKAVKYGEDEEPFALQRAETGDIRINREHQSQSVNQQKDYQKPQPKRNFEAKNEKDIFKSSSSSNFFNNKNNGKENDEDYDDSVNVNQDRDIEHRRKVVRKQHRRPVQPSRNDYNQASQQQQQPSQQQQPQQQQGTSGYNNRNNYRQIEQSQELQKNISSTSQTRRPQRPTGFTNNYAGSSYIPTTQRPSSTTFHNDQYTTASITSNNIRGRSGQRQRGNSDRQFNNGASYASPSSQNTYSPTPTYSISTPAPFRQSPQVTNSRQTTQYNSGQYYTDNGVSSTENYPQPRPTTAVSPSINYDVPKVTKSTENYPSNNPQYSKITTPFSSSQYNTAFDKKPTSPKKFETSKSTTFSTNAKPFSGPNIPQDGHSATSGFPTTFAPRTNQAYTQIAQQTTYTKDKTQNPSTNGISQQRLSTFGQQFNSPSSTQKATTFTQYTPTVPKITSTTPVSRSIRFDETQYDDGSYDGKGDDEFLKTAHSQNIASSRNEYAKVQRQQQQQVTTTTTQKPFDISRSYSTTTYAPRATENYSRNTQFASTKKTQKPVENRPVETIPKATNKKVKDVSYDYAYYDSLGAEPDYQLDTDIKKSTVTN